MERLQPLEADYYGTSGWYSGGEQDESDSSEDEIQKQFRKIAEGRADGKSSSDDEQQATTSFDDGMQRQKKRCKKTKPIYEPGMHKSVRAAECAEFTSSMDAELHNELIAFSADSWMPEFKTVTPIKPKSTETKLTSQSISKEKKVQFAEDVSKDQKKKAEDDVDPSLGLNDNDDSDEEFRRNEGMQTSSNKPDEQTNVNDSLFYDPSEDDDNEHWVDAHRQENRGKQNKPTNGEDEPKKVKALENSDAVLNCPACMALLCLDCQRHAFFKTQYRAMFVENCVINNETQVYLPKIDEGIKRLGKRTMKQRQHGNRTVDTMETDDKDVVRANDRFPYGQAPATCKSEDLFLPVECEVCRTEVAVIDDDEVYHFFNVLSSYT